jgi:hypothetical protein
VSRGGVIAGITSAMLTTFNPLLIAEQAHETAAHLERTRVKLHLLRNPNIPQAVQLTKEDIAPLSESLVGEAWVFKNITAAKIFEKKAARAKLSKKWFLDY